MANRGRLGFFRLFGLIILMVTGFFFVQRIWTVESNLRDARSNAFQLEKLYGDALNEAADWRNKYDADIKKVTELLQEKANVVETLEMEHKSLQQTKENLEKELAALKGELLIARANCQKI